MLAQTSFCFGFESMMARPKRHNSHSLPLRERDGHFTEVTTNRQCELVIVTDSGEINAGRADIFSVTLACALAWNLQRYRLVLLLFMGVQGASLRGEDRVHLSSE